MPKREVRPAKHDFLKEGEYRVISRLTETDTMPAITPQHVMRVLKGECEGSWGHVCRIADAAGVTLDEVRAHIEWMKREREADRKATLQAVRNRKEAVATT